MLTGDGSFDKFNFKQRNEGVINTQEKPESTARTSRSIASVFMSGATKNCENLQTREISLPKKNTKSKRLNVTESSNIVFEMKVIRYEGDNSSLKSKKKSIELRIFLYYLITKLHTDNKLQTCLPTHMSPPLVNFYSN